MRAAVLLTCFNRKEKTLACLKSIYFQMPVKELELVIYLVDDGSTDGTGEAVADEFPEVKILYGDGSLYWNGGMSLAWHTAALDYFDYYIWMNDDIDVKTDAFFTMFASCEEATSVSQLSPVIVGCFSEPGTGKHAYGGFSVKRSFLRMKTIRKIPNGNIMPCDSFNGNLVLIPAHVVDKVGLLDTRYRHAFGDKDYGYRCLKNNIPMYITPVYVGECARNGIQGTWMDPGVSIRVRYSRLIAPNGLPPSEYFYSYKKNSNTFVGIVAVVKLYARLLFPRLWSQISTRNSGE